MSNSSPMPQHSRPNPPSGVLTLADLMILVAAVALGLLGMRSFWNGVPVGYMALYEFFPFYGLMMLTPLASTLTLALIAIPLSTFRSRLRRLTRFPGMIACLGVMAAMSLIAVRWVIRSFTAPFADGTPWTYYGQFTYHSLVWCGLGAVAALVPAVIGDCRRFRPDPADWLRLAIAIYWVLMVLAVGAI
jgi:hypothetical protein